jgi:inositol polyphosphate-4-phosphatase
MQKLPKKLAAGEWFHVQTIYWNIGINVEATMAASVGDTSLEEGINRAALILTDSYVNRFPLSNSALQDITREIKTMVEENPTRKNVAIFPKVMALTILLGGICALGCKSGKDRTSMAVTLEEGRLLKETCGISQQQMPEIVEALRHSTLRRENCRKNIGKALYSFSPFQIQFLPKEFRPPPGTFAANLAS